MRSAKLLFVGLLFVVDGAGILAHGVGVGEENAADLEPARFPDTITDRLRRQSAITFRY